MAHEGVLAGARLDVPAPDTGVQGARDHVNPVKLGGGVEVQVRRDKVRVPRSLRPGSYVLAFRWDCELTPQVPRIPTTHTYSTPLGTTYSTLPYLIFSTQSYKTYSYSRWIGNKTIFLGEDPSQKMVCTRGDYETKVCPCGFFFLQ